MNLIVPEPSSLPANSSVYTAFKDYFAGLRTNLKPK